MKAEILKQVEKQIIELIQKDDSAAASMASS